MGNNNVRGKKIEGDLSFLSERENNNLDEQKLETDANEKNSAAADMESGFDDQEDPLVSWLFDMESIVQEQETESDFGEQEWGTDDDVQEEMESYTAEQVPETNVAVFDQGTSISSAEKDNLMSSFLENCVGQSVQTAKQYLEATNWDLEGALGLFWSAPVRYPKIPNTSYELINLGEANIRAGMVQPDVNAVDDNLASMYPPPVALMYDGPFHKAKKSAEDEDKWLIVNVQSKQEFSSLTLNLDTWAHEAVSQTISANFIFWQVYDDIIEGQKICNYYKLTSFPAVLVLDPITGQNVKSWTGMIEAVQLLEDLAPYMDAGPKHHLTLLSRKRPAEISKQTTLPETTEEEDEELFQAILASMENMTTTVAPACSDSIEEPVTSSSNKLTYPDLPEEPKVDKTLLCRIGVRLPDGRRLQRNFLRTDPVQMLWSFCNSQLDEAESRPFHLTQAIPGSPNTLAYESKQTFEESGLSNSMISVTWD
ncbi:plant UBX domain-containing protein 7-like [Papaver somniferum]|uniref:plant UBX domain-containing protein 7-like n=1 Tax=Papaver somniferum TaxID=3469 RepID=UPI000E6FF663|nr:plant UBX domain-containing protein 7-like [Papaver somniferum]